MGQNARIRNLRSHVRAGKLYLSDHCTPQFAPWLRLRPRTIRRIQATPCPRLAFPPGRPASRWIGGGARWFPVPEPAPVPKAAQAYARAEERRESKRRARALRGAVIVDDPLDVVPA